MRGGTRAIVAGALVLTAVVAFFVVTSIRDHGLLKGAHAYGTVVRTIPSGGLNPFDNGRLVVAFTPEGRSRRTVTIWLDDTRDLDEGDHVDVRYEPDDPGRARTTTDANDPVPLGGWALLCGLAGIGLVALGIALRREPQPKRRRRRGRKGPTPSRDRPDLTPFEEAAYAVGAAAMLGATVAFVLVVHHRDADLWAHGIPTSGVVQDGGSNGGRHSQSWVPVAYDAAGRHLVERLHGPTPDGTRPGKVLRIRYDPDNPRRFRTEGHTNHGDLTDEGYVVLPLLTGFAVWSVGARAVERCRRRRWRDLNSRWA